MENEATANLVLQAISDLNERFKPIDNPLEEAEVRDKCRNIIPLEYAEYELLSLAGGCEKFTANFRVFNFDVQDVDKFIKCYCNVNNETLRANNSRRSSSDNRLLEKSFRCQHTRYEPTRNRKKFLTNHPHKRLKNTNCRFLLTFKFVKQDSCMDSLEWDHNHPINALQVLTYKDISPETIVRINNYFVHGYTPSLAYRQLLREIKTECENEGVYAVKLADRSTCPRRGDFNNLYTGYCRTKYGAKNGIDMFNNTVERLKKYTEESGTNIKYQIYNKEEDCPLIIAIVTPLMIRVHSEVSDSKKKTIYHWVNFLSGTIAHALTI